MLLLTTLAPSARALDASQWKFREPLTVEAPGIVKVALPASTLGAARSDIGDLRLLDAAGAETPFIIETPAPAIPVSLRPAESFRATLTDSTTEILIETGRRDEIDAVALRIPPTTFQAGDSSFIKAARVEISNNEGSWEVIHTGMPLFRQSGTGVAQLRIPLEGRRAERVRITIDDRHSKPEPFVGAEILFSATKTKDETLPLEVRVARRDEFTGETVLTLDLGAAHIPLAALQFDTTEPLFSRRLTVTVRELRGETVSEHTLAEGTIYRVSAEGLSSSSSLRVAIDCVAPSSEVLVHIANGDSPPLTISGVAGRQQPRWLVYRGRSRGPFLFSAGIRRLPRRITISPRLPLRFAPLPCRR
jgi:hypothetical protein